MPTPMDFAKIFSDAQKVPEGSEAPSSLDLFAPPSATAPTVVVRELDDEGEDRDVIPNLPRYELDYRCQRFFMGKEIEAIDQNQKVFRDVDDSEELRQVLEAAIHGKAVIFTRRDSVLQDGSIVVWLEWGVKAKKTKKAKEGVLSTAQLLSPERVTPKSRAEDAAKGFPVSGEDDEAAPGSAASELANPDEGESHEDEPDWE